MAEIARIADQLQRAFRGPAWHGPAVMELLADVAADQAAAHPVPHAHSIWEIVLHLGAWERAGTRRIGGEAVALSRVQDWPPIPRFSEEGWRLAVRELEQAHEALHAAIQQMPEARLAEPCPGKKYDFYFLLHGLVQHDLYHAGQIALLKNG